MKIRGSEKGLVPVGTVRLPRPSGDDIVLGIQGVPLGFYERAAQCIGEPHPPRNGWVRDDKGRLERDGDDRPIPAFATDDPAFKAAMDQYNRRLTTMWMLEALTPSIQDGTIVIEAVKGDDLGAWLDAVWKEFQAVGFTVGDLKLITDAINEISNMDDRSIEDAGRPFTRRRK